MNKKSDHVHERFIQVALDRVFCRCQMCGTFHFLDGEPGAVLKECPKVTCHSRDMTVYIPVAYLASGRPVVGRIPAGYEASPDD